MSVTQKLVTHKFNVQAAEHFVSSIQTGDSAFYVYAANHVPYTPDDSYIAVPNNSVQATVYDPYNNMIFGKRIQDADVNLMINRVEWKSGTVYDMYDHTKDLATLNYYVFVQNGTIWNVYKCISNGYGSPSTVAPTGQSVSPLVSPVDGYVWKYMGTTSGAIYDKFKTQYYAPFTANASIIAGSTAGTIEFISVSDKGQGYNNWYKGTFRTQDLTLGGLSTVYAIGDDASPNNNYYEGCIIKMTSGNATGQYRQILKYQYTNNQHQIYLDNPFNGTVLQGDTYEVFPGVYIFGDGNETTNCIARAVVNTAVGSGNSISYVDILNTGAGYRSADALLIQKAVVGVTANAVLMPIISPPGGHGSDPYNELLSTRACVSVSFRGTENNNIPASNDYRQIGIIKDPLFDGVTLSCNTQQQIGNFVPGENIYQYRPIWLYGYINCYSNSTITGLNTQFSSSVQAGDYIYFSSGTANYFGQVFSVDSNTSLTLTSNVPFTAQGLQFALANTTGIGTVTSVSTGSINVTGVDTRNVSPTVQTIISDQTFTSSFVNSLSVNGNALNGLFDTYVELERFTGAMSSGTYIQDETVDQVSALVVQNAQDPANTYAAALLGYQPTAKLHSVVTGGQSDLMYLTNVKHIFNTGNTINGQSSTAQFNLSYKYTGDLVRDSGDIVYVENVDPITRQSNKNETVKIILEF